MILVAYANRWSRQALLPALAGRPVRAGGEGFEEQMAWSLGRLPRRETRLELETLRERQVCVDPSRRFRLPHRPLAHRAVLAG